MRRHLQIFLSGRLPCNTPRKNLNWIRSIGQDGPGRAPSNDVMRSNVVPGPTRRKPGLVGEPAHLARQLAPVLRSRTSGTLSTFDRRGITAAVVSQYGPCKVLDSTVPNSKCSEP
ncbi:hypothetical protein M0657_010175 [Pyricularia oryzae]|nr:hypothetical protein M9X92_010176 [Pyricularia oryzae]KAI7913079.1 hypothetical protein M0657_010175 [Pyricularia oryzae]